MSLYVYRNRRLIRDGSPGRPPRLSHSGSRALSSLMLGVCPVCCDGRLGPAEMCCWSVSVDITLRASLSGTFLQRKGVVNQCLELAWTQNRCRLMEYAPQFRRDVIAQSLARGLCLVIWCQGERVRQFIGDLSPTAYCIACKEVGSRVLRSCHWPEV